MNDGNIRLKNKKECWDPFQSIHRQIKGGVMGKKRHLFSILVFLGISFLFSLDGRAQTTKLRVTAETAQIRVKPDVESLVIREVSMGTILESGSKEGGWFKVNFLSSEEQLTVIGFILESEVEVFEEETKKTEVVTPIAVQQLPETPKPSGFKFGLGLKFSGGLSYLLDGAGDLEVLRQGREDYYEAWGAEETYQTSFDWGRMTFIPDLNVDLIVNLGKYLGIGFGTGFIKASSKGDYSADYDYPHPEGNYLYDIDYDYARNYRLTAIPIRSNLYFFLPLKNFSFFGYGGVGVYLGKLTNSYSSMEDYYYESPMGSPTYKHEEEYEWNADEESRSTATGFQGGLGFELKIPPVIILGMEFYGRLLNFNDWEGSRSWSWTEHDRYWSAYSGWYRDETDGDSGEYQGYLWVYNDYDSYMDMSYTNMWIRDNEPSGDDYSNANHAAINLNAAGVLFFIRIHFDIF